MALRRADTARDAAPAGAAARPAPTHEYIWLVVVYAAFFYPAWPAAAYWLGCGVVSGMPLLYADSAVEHDRARAVHPRPLLRDRRRDRDEVQVRWIAAHHERPDGEGYPNGLTGAEIPEGAARLALADAWDSMVSVRLYSPPRAIQEALEEIRALAGRQFTVEAVQALEALHERGALAMAAARMHRPTPEPATPHAP